MLPKINKKSLVVLLFILLIVMSISGFFIFKLLSQETSNEKVGPIYETQEFTVNASQSVNHYIKMQLAMELSNNNVLKELNSKLPLLEDAVIMVLSEQSAEVLTIEGKEKLKSKIINAVNSFLQKGTVNNIYFKTLLFS